MFLKLYIEIRKEGSILENGLNSKMTDIFRENGSVKRFKAKEIIFQKNDTADYIYLLTEGKVRAYMLYPNGTERTLCFVERGNLVGEEVFSENHQRIVNADAVTNAVLYCMDGKSLLYSCLQSNVNLEILLAFFMKKITLLSSLIFYSQFMKNDRKIAYYLYSNFKMGKKTIYYTHEQIAETTGMNRVSATKILNDFEKKGLIKLNYKYIHILKEKELEDIFGLISFFDF